MIGWIVMCFSELVFQFQPFLLSPLVFKVVLPQTTNYQFPEQAKAAALKSRIFIQLFAFLTFLSILNSSVTS